MKVTVTVPATSANLGPGFDCLGLALSLRNEIVLAPAVDPALPGVTISGEGEGLIPTDERNLVLRAARLVFERVGASPQPFDLFQRNRIPVGSGLGSSAAAVLSGLLAADAWVDGRLSPDEILTMAVALEGHPDNVAPALYGGLTLVTGDGDGWHVERIATPPLTAVVVLPDFELSTARARAALPDQVPLRDATFNAAHLALLLRGLAAGDHALIGRGMQDRLHQPYRLPLIPGMAEAFAAARAAGATAVALSGAGPSLIAFAEGGYGDIGTAVQEAFRAAGLDSRAFQLEADVKGSAVKLGSS